MEIRKSHRNNLLERFTCVTAGVIRFFNRPYLYSNNRPPKTVYTDLKLRQTF